MPCPSQSLGDLPGCCRSPAVVIAYLMRLRRWRLNESFKWVQERRPTINLSAGMLAAGQVWSHFGSAHL